MQVRLNHNLWTFKKVHEGGTGEEITLSTILAKHA